MDFPGIFFTSINGKCQKQKKYGSNNTHDDRKKGYFRAAAGIFIWSNGGGENIFLSQFTGIDGPSVGGRREANKKASSSKLD